MEYPSEEYKSFIVLPHTFSAIRVFDEKDVGAHLTATDITLKFSCTPTNEDADAGAKAMIGYQRLRAWLDAVMQNIIIIDVNSPMIGSLHSGTSNLLMHTPGRTDDALLSLVFHSKATAIAEGLLDIHSIWLVSTDTENSERYYRNTDGEYGLPDISYFNERTATDGRISSNKRPWWERSTVDICEIAQEDGEDVVWFEVDPLLDIGKEYLTETSEADIIVFDAWKKKDK